MASGACIALRLSGTLKYLYGLPEETPQSENLQAQAPQAHEGESPQEAFALQVVAVHVGRASGLGRSARSARSLRQHRPATRFANMFVIKRSACLRAFCFAIGLLGTTVFARPPLTLRALPTGNPVVQKKSDRQDDSTTILPAKDLTLRAEGQRKADALVNFVDGSRLEESGEIDDALEAYQKVLNVDPGEADLASRVATLLLQQGNVPRAIDVLKDAIKATPKASSPYLQLALIYAKYLRKPEQALKYANQAIAIDPDNFDTYQRVYEIEVAVGDQKSALLALDRAGRSHSDDPTFWTRLGKLCISLVLHPDREPSSGELTRVNGIFKKAVDHAQDDPAVLKEVADYYAATQQINQAIPLYLRVLELQPDDSNAREKLATGFVLTNQRVKAAEMLQEIIKVHPEKYQAYDLLAQLFDEEGRALARANQPEKAEAEFVKAAGNYEQSLLIQPDRANTYIRLAELLVGPVGDSERAISLLQDARQRFPDAPELTYLLAIALRVAKHQQQAVTTFEEALHEAEASGSEIINAHFYFEYGAAAEQAELYDKAADLFKRNIALDPANAAEACNYLSYMWVEHGLHLDEAEDMVNRALKLDPNNGAYLDTLGWLAYQRGKFDEALKALLRAAQNLPHLDAVVLEHIGDTYAKLNLIPQALDYWQKAVILAPENKKLSEKIESTKTTMSAVPRPNPMQ